MKNRIVILCLMLLTGCASRRISTPEIALNSPPANFVGARVALENIRFFEMNVPAQVQTGVGYNAGATVAGAMNGSIVTPSFVVLSGDPQQAGLTYNLFAERRL